MITERDKIKCKASVEMVDASPLDPAVKADLKESIEESCQNLNGRTLKERVYSIAQAQFDTARFLAELIVRQAAWAREGARTRTRSWKDVLVEGQWAWAALGSVVAVCCIFQPQIVSLLKALCQLL